MPLPRDLSKPSSRDDDIWNEVSEEIDLKPDDTDSDPAIEIRKSLVFALIRTYGGHRNGYEISEDAALLEDYIRNGLT